jgi:hypothetical protein
MKVLDLIKNPFGFLGRTNNSKARQADQPVEDIVPYDNLVYFERSGDGATWEPIEVGQLRAELGKAYRELDETIDLVWQGGIARAGGFQYRRRRT